MNVIYGLVLCLYFSYTTVQGTSESALIAKLFKSCHDKAVRPVEKAADNMTVKVNLVPNVIREVNIEERQVQFDAWIYMEWEDLSRTFDADKYGIEYLVLPPYMVWKPDIAIHSTFSEYTYLSAKSNVVVYSNGTTVWVPPVTVKSLCPPTESQITEDAFVCNISIGSLTYPVQMLDVQALEQEPLLSAEDSFLNIHREWSLESMTASSEQKKLSCSKDLYSVVKYDLRFRKRSAEESCYTLVFQ